MKYRIAFALLVPAVAMPAQGRIELPVSLSQLEESARRDSNDAVAHYNLALGFWNERRWDDVEESLRRSLELDPRLALSHMALSRLPYARHSRLGEDLLAGSGFALDQNADISDGCRLGLLQHVLHQLR